MGEPQTRHKRQRGQQRQQPQVFRPGGQCQGFHLSGRAGNHGEGMLLCWVLLWPSLQPTSLSSTQIISTICKLVVPDRLQGGRIFTCETLSTLLQT